MPFDCIIVDFDGTFTDVEREALPFLEAYRKDLSEFLGLDLTEAWNVASSHIGAKPHEFGWEFEGRIVAPSNADPYIMATSIAQKLLDDRGLLSDAGERRIFLERIFRENYPKAANVFQPEARDAIEEILASGLPVFVVTNSDTDAVRDKLGDLDPKGGERLRVLGNAKKYVIAEPEPSDEVFDALPDELRVEGLSRPVFTRRGPYYELLRQIMAETGASPARTIICGDIYELDLAMPAALGIGVHLAARPTTPAYERKAVGSLPSGTVGDDLRDFVRRALA